MRNCEHVRERLLTTNLKHSLQIFPKIASLVTHDACMPRTLAVSRSPRQPLRCNLQCTLCFVRPRREEKLQQATSRASSKNGSGRGLIFSEPRCHIHLPFRKFCKVRRSRPQKSHRLPHSPSLLFFLTRASSSLACRRFLLMRTYDCKDRATHSVRVGTTAAPRFPSPLTFAPVRLFQELHSTAQMF